MDEDHTKVNTDEVLQDRVTIREASTLLGVHPNTVRKRVKDGVYEAERISTEHGFTWMIHRNTLLNTPPTEDTQISPLQSAGNLETTPEAFVQAMLSPFVEDLGRVREELGAERVLREQAERERDRLSAELEAFREARDAPETAAEDTDSVDVPPQEDVQRRSWLYRFFFGS
jgi:hypothetical protein